MLVFPYLKLPWCAVFALRYLHYIVKLRPPISEVIDSGSIFSILSSSVHYRFLISEMGYKDYRKKKMDLNPGLLVILLVTF